MLTSVGLGYSNSKTKLSGLISTVFYLSFDKLITPNSKAELSTSFQEVFDQVAVLNNHSL